MTLYLTHLTDDPHRTLQKILEEHTGIQALRFGTSPGGKPYVIPYRSPSPVFFSLSHSGNLLAVLIHIAPVGVDLQQHTQLQTDAVAKRWFHPEEYAAYLGGGCPERDFFTLWSAKEAYVKYTGQGIGSTFRRFSVLSVTEFLRSVPYLPGYALAVCTAYESPLSIVPLFLGENTPVAADLLSIRDAVYH